MGIIGETLEKHGRENHRQTTGKSKGRKPRANHRKTIGENHVGTIREKTIGKQHWRTIVET